jgi:preprotein translocase subunit YajC
LAGTLAAGFDPGYMPEPLNIMISATIPLILGDALSGSLGTNLVFFAALFGIMYFVLIRPQQKQAKEQQTMLGSLKKGDDVVTQGGLIGKIFAVSEKTVTLEVAAGVKMRILKSSIQARGTVSDEVKVEATEPRKEEK